MSGFDRTMGDAPLATPLAQLIAAGIRAGGPMRIDEYMQLCLLHPEHGYYATRDPFGAHGDFTTAPEISQMFGEMIGLALAQAWLDQGQPKPFTLAEIGPGRGTLMADLLRAIKIVPGMREAADVILIEASPHLRQLQRDKLGQVRHLDRIEDLPKQPLFLIANELFDALPIRQFQRARQGWSERIIALDPQGGLALGLAAPIKGLGDGGLGDLLPQDDPDLPEGEIREICPLGVSIASGLGALVSQYGGAAIFIDYGTWDGHGDSFQALRRHQPEDVLAHPGEADLTAHVDFAPLARAAHRQGAAVSGLVTQGAWLQAMGIATRAERLAAAGDAGAMQALHRLTGGDEMGQLFKAMAIWSPKFPPPPGFQPQDPDAHDA
ncbi:SAM-dependent methyltransferase [Paracoccus sp. (in: a-proteobacteria)]|uniref:class I SAM-dependent methyltransferase n=1 Tax=Paracoccus sp. TaxID=267 RepID=UPI00289B00E0|nr:SAM-dependent methyltransferase [Paracoccus sp. (in: a-proteobacteria)]